MYIIIFNRDNRDRVFEECRGFEAHRRHKIVQRRTSTSAREETRYPRAKGRLLDAIDLTSLENFATAVDGIT